jgi:hypothetical protein
MNRYSEKRIYAVFLILTAYGKNDYFSSIIPIVLKTPKKTMKKEDTKHL